MNMLLDALSAVFWGALVLSVVVLVHEGGHYAVARACGVRVTEFFMGLPSRFKLSRKSKRHGTEFGITLFLLGGYNRIAGMEGTQDELMAPAFAIVQREGRVSAQAVADELGIDLDRCYGILASLSDLVAIRPFYDANLGEFPTQRDYPQSFETLARDANMLTEYDSGHDFNGDNTTGDGEPRPLQNAAVQLEFERKRTFVGCNYLQRLAMLLAGPAVNLVLAFVLVVGSYMSVEYRIVINENVIGEVTEGSLADVAGLKAGDAIVAVDGTEVSDWEEVSEALDAAKATGQDFAITYERDGSRAEVRIDVPEGEEVQLIGVAAKTEPYHLSLGKAIQGACNYVGLVGGTVARLLMPAHTMEVLDNSSSVVGISVMASQAASAGALDLIAIVAAISMSLGFMNLLPIPPLDGGKIVIQTLEAIIRRPVPIKVQLAFSYVGMAFFAFVFVFVVRADIVRLFLG